MTITDLITDKSLEVRANTVVCLQEGVYKFEVRCDNDGRLYIRVVEFSSTTRHIRITPGQ